MPLLKDSPLKTIAQCRLGQPISISSCELRVWLTTSCGPTGALISANPGCNPPPLVPRAFWPNFNGGRSVSGHFRPDYHLGRPRRGGLGGLTVYEGRHVWPIYTHERVYKGHHVWSSIVFDVSLFDFSLYAGVADEPHIFR